MHKKTLTWWVWVLGKEEGATARPSDLAIPAADDVEPATFTEVTPPSSTWWAASERIEVVVGELAVRVPDTFDPRTLRAVLDVLTGDES